MAIVHRLSERKRDAGDDGTNEALVTIHWNGGRHTELRVSRVRTGRYPADRQPSPVEAMRKLGGCRIASSR
jgi:hypothetical protein